MNTTYFLNLVAGNVMGTQTDPAIPGKYYLALSQEAPSLDGTGVVEPDSAAGYARIEMTNLSAPVDGVITNNSELAFNESTGDWGVLTHYGIFDAETGGNLLMYEALTQSRTVETGTVMVVRPGYLKLSVINP